MLVYTGCTRASGLIHIALCARERLAEQNRAQDREYKRALRDRLRVCGKCKRLVREMRETRSVGQSEATMRSIQRHGLCLYVRFSELANMHYKLISN